MTRLRFRRDGRALVAVDLPDDVVARADELSRSTGRDRADVLGDLVAEQLPDVLAEAARQRLGCQTGTTLVEYLEYDALGPRLISRAPTPAELCDGDSRGGVG